MAEDHAEDSLQITVEAPPPEYNLLQVEGIQFVSDGTVHGVGTLTLTSKYVLFYNKY